MPIAEPAIVDPACGRPVDPLRARAVGIYGGQTRYFCSAACKAEYARSYAADLAETKAAPMAPLEPEAVLPGLPVIAARPAAAPPVDRVAAPPRSRASSGPVVVAAIAAIAAIAVAAWLRPRPQVPVVPSPVAVAQPVAPVPAPAPVAMPAAVAASVPAYDGSLKLGLRRFAEGTTWSVRLVLIDDAGTSTVVTVATGEGDAIEGAVAPEPDFAHTRREPGVVFKDPDVEVERRATELVVRARTGEKVVAHLAEDTAVRAAPFARARYGEK